MSKYRHRDISPVPLHAVCNGMAVSMYREIKALHKLLLATALEQGVSPEDVERAIVRQIEILRKEGGACWFF